MHVAILTSILMSFLLGFGLWKKHAFWLTILLIMLFIVMTGFQSSAIRAGIMGGLFLLSRYFGRQNLSVRAVLFAATIMLFLNPLLLIYDVGFQLSFLAVLGIILFTPTLEKCLNKITNRFQIRNILSMTLAAQIFTLPILVFNFGQISLIAPFSNILIIPFLPLIMILGFIFILLGTILQPLAFILSLPLWVLLSYLLLVVKGFSSLSFSAVFFNVSWYFLPIYYAVLFSFVWFFRKRLKNSYF